MTSVKVDGFLRPFRGKVNDWSRFWDKFQLLASIQGWDTEGKRTKHSPLFLEGDVFLVYTRMADADKKKEQEIRRKMEQSFALTKAEAYGKFVTRKLKEDESPDAYVADFQTLAALSGHNVDDDEGPMLIEQLMAGLPQEYAKEFRLSMAIKTRSAGAWTQHERWEPSLRTPSCIPPTCTLQLQHQVQVQEWCDLHSRRPCVFSLPSSGACPAELPTTELELEEIPKRNGANVLLLWRWRTCEAGQSSSGSVAEKHAATSLQWSIS